MKKVLTVALALILVLSLASCFESDGSGSGTSGDHTADEYPRYTGFDGTSSVARANLQNCHITYTYDADCEGDPSTVLTGEYITCLNRQYYRTYSLYGYSQHIKGDTEYTQPDNHYAFVFKDGQWTVYDFFRKIIATGGEPDYHDGKWSDGIEVTSFSHNTLLLWELDAETFEPTDKYGIAECLDKIDGRTVCGKSCNGWMRYTSYTSGDYTQNAYDYRLWVDPETHLTLRYEWYVGHYDLTEPGNVFEVTGLKLNCVSQKAFDEMIAKLVEDMGGEEKFQKTSWSEYWDMFV